MALIPAHTDIAAQSGLMRFLPQKLRPFALLARWDRPIGTMLLLWPCLWGAMLGAVLVPISWRMGEIFLLFCVGALVMRAAGCVINDLWDRRIDRQVARTRGRPLASGAVSVSQALVFLAGLLLLGLGVLILLPRQVLVLALLSLPLVVLYPLAKRFFPWPQLVLGLTFNWGALLGFLAMAGHLEPAAWWLYAAGLCWTLGYDTIYAFQDRSDDARLGLRSTALVFGPRAGPCWVAGFYTVFVACLAQAMMQIGAGWSLAAIGVLPLTVHLIGQIQGWNPDDAPACLRRFRSNAWAGFWAFVGCAWVWGWWVFSTGL